MVASKAASSPRLPLEDNNTSIIKTLTSKELALPIYNGLSKKKSMLIQSKEGVPSEEKDCIDSMITWVVERDDGSRMDIVVFAEEK
ncbi:hypothetical protein LXL04_025731 [Taraxacum kok-saghyz]